MIGTSYVGGTQHALAIEGSPHLTALVPVDAMSNPGRFGIRHAGAFEMRWLNWALTLGNPGIHAVTPDGRRTDEILSEAGEPTGRWLLPTGGVGTADDNAELRDRLAARAAAVARVGGDVAARTALFEMGDHSRRHAQTLPFKEGAAPLKFAPDYEAWLVEAMSHGDDDEHWRGMGISVVDEAARYQDVPILHVTGAYDYREQVRSPTSTSQR